MFLLTCGHLTGPLLLMGPSSSAAHLSQSRKLKKARSHVLVEAVVMSGGSNKSEGVLVSQNIKAAPVQEEHGMSSGAPVSDEVMMSAAVVKAAPMRERRGVSSGAPVFDGDEGDDEMMMSAAPVKRAPVREKRGVSSGPPVSHAEVERELSRFNQLSSAHSSMQQQLEQEREELQAKVGRSLYLIAVYFKGRFTVEI